MKYFYLLLSLVSLSAMAASFQTPDQKTQNFLKDPEERSALYRKEEPVLIETSGASVGVKESDPVRNIASDVEKDKK